MLTRGTIVGKHGLLDWRAPHPEALRDIPQYQSSREQRRLNLLFIDNDVTAIPQAGEWADELSIQDEMFEARPIDAEQLASMRDDWASYILGFAEECHEEGMRLAARAAALEQWADDVEG